MGFQFPDFCKDWIEEQLSPSQREELAALQRTSGISNHNDPFYRYALDCGGLMLSCLITRGQAHDNNEPERIAIWWEIKDFYSKSPIQFHHHNGPAMLSIVRYGTSEYQSETQKVARYYIAGKAYEHKEWRRLRFSPVTK